MSVKDMSLRTWLKCFRDDEIKVLKGLTPKHRDVRYSVGFKARNFGKRFENDFQGLALLLKSDKLTAKEKYDIFSTTVWHVRFLDYVSRQIVPEIEEYERVEEDEMHHQKYMKLQFKKLRRIERNLKGIRNRVKVVEKLMQFEKSDVRSKIIRLVFQRGPLTSDLISHHLNKDKRTITKLCNLLCRKNILKKIQYGNGYDGYFLTKEALLPLSIVKTKNPY